MITRVVQRKRPRRSAMAVVGAGVILAASLLATGVLATVFDSGTYDLMVDSKNDPTKVVDVGNATVEYIPSAGVNQSSGTGIFDPFVRLQGSPTENGYNTDGAVQFDAKTGRWTHAILASAIPIVDCDGDPLTVGSCWELFNDINENNTAKYISLTMVQIWFANSPTLVGYDETSHTFASGATLQYEFTGEIKINDVNQGSGRGDLRYLVPVIAFTATDWFVLYSEWGSSDAAPDGKTFASDGGFEEWKVRKAPNLSIVKTADAASVSAGTNIGFTITVTNSGVADATGVTVNDPLPGGTGVDWSIASQSPAGSCSITGTPPSETLTCGPLTLAAGGGSLTVHVTSSTTAASCGTYNNTATFTSTNAGSGTATDLVTVQCGALLILKQSTKTAGDPPVNTPVLIAGAEFCYSTTTGCTVTNVTDNGTGDVDSTTIGTVCVSGLAPGTYYINETAAPDGYGGASQSDVAVTVANGTSCTAGSLPAAAATATFTNPPLAEIEVLVTDLGSGETNSSIVCAQSTTTIDAVLEDGADDPAFDDTDEVFTGLAPGTYTCTVVVDP